jgi:GH15 family glucan-1,4-alpha-glucosidase
MSTYPAIADYAFISDCHSAALIARDASVEWACFHRFDNRSVFARLLDRERGGFFRIAPVGPSESSRRYIPETNVLETRFETATGVVTVTDCLPLRRQDDAPGGAERPAPHHLLLRQVRGEAGSVELELEVVPRFDYGLTTPLLDLQADDLAVVIGGADSLLLHSDLRPLERTGPGSCRARATLAAGQEAWVALTYAPAGKLQVQRHTQADKRARLDQTVEFWQDWSGRCSYQGPYRDAVVRSALVLKGLTNAPTGAVVAAPTTSLPEEVGGERNWDYRFSWLRDSVAMLSALAGLGHLQEAQEFAAWMLRTAAGRAEDLQIMYGIGGERLLNEFQLEHLEGYCGSRPVRVGNGAWNQFQLDTYGELLEAVLLHVLLLRGQTSAPLGQPFGTFLRDVVETAIRRWQDADEGIWEVRGGRQHFVFSKLMAWVAVDRGLRLLRTTLEKADLERWTAVRDEIRARIESEGVDPESGAFVQAFGSRSLDASTLQLGLRGFLPFEDPRIQATTERIDRELTRNGHVYRYLDRRDGLAGGEGSFVFCTLWLVSSLALGGEIERAQARLDQVLACANDLGLLAEEIDPDTGVQLGNFPQGFSHLGVISAALNLQRAQAGLRSSLVQAAEAVS